MASVPEFRASITADLYPVDAFADWQVIDARRAELAEALQWLSTEDRPLAADRLGAALGSVPGLVELLNLTLAIAGGVGFDDGREVPASASRYARSFSELADLYIALGINRLLISRECDGPVTDQAILASGAAKRRFKVSERFAARTAKALAVALANLVVDGFKAENAKKDILPFGIRRSVDHLVSFDGNPRVGLSTTFQANTGGRQQRDLSLLLPRLQDELREFDIELVVIADGRGVRDAPDRALEQLFSGVFACMTLRQAESGELNNALRLAAASRAQEVPEDRTALSEIVGRLLHQRGIVTASELPTSSRTAMLVLARYAADRGDYDLALDPEAATLRWTKLGLIDRCQSLRVNFRTEEAISVAASLLDGQAMAVKGDAKGQYTKLEMGQGALLPSAFVIAANRDDDTQAAMHWAARIALLETPDAKLAFLVVPSRSGESLSDSWFLSNQRMLAANVIVITPDDLMDIARSSRSARALIREKILEQADLTKASPFVLNSATPARIYYGREEEEARVAATVATNSIAILGGRRIGKTSLLLNVAARLREAGISVYAADCQTVATWSDFRKLAQREWGVEGIQEAFSPSALFQLIDRLAGSDSQKIVIALDEVDRLLAWDLHEREGQVNEPFFRACRTVSQSGKAQFIFSGERTIANKLWDPQSPHWNFCTPLQLRQLSRKASTALLIEPIEALGVTFKDPANCDEAVWTRSNGHPQIVQFMGDQLVGLLNSRDPDNRFELCSADILAVTDSFEFAEHYVETYWGQSTRAERLLSLIICAGASSARSILQETVVLVPSFREDMLRMGGRMLELYGIVDRTTDGYELRASWFPDALTFFGDPGALALQMATEVEP